MNSLASNDEAHNTHLSASSTGNTDTLSSSELSAHSTARTSAMLTDDDRPGASSPSGRPEHAHPIVNILELVSNTASSSALPDSFGFDVSRKGSFVAIYTASSIWLIKTEGLPRLWARTLEVKRKPVAIDVTEDGFLLAVLSRPSQVDLYEIHGEQDRQIKKRRTIMLVHEATSIVISPDGLILITGSKYGIEVVSIGLDAPESCRRTLSGPVGDKLEFSDDGRTLLITSYARKNTTSSLYILPGLYDGPLSEEGEPIPASPEAVWTGLVLFPETARIARQATLLPDCDTGQVNELFAFNADDDTWGVYDIASQRFTQTKMFLPDQQRWTRSEFIDDAMPAISPNSDFAAVALRIRGTTSLWIYQVPEWDYKAKEKNITPSPIQPCFMIPILQDGTDTHQEISVLRWVKTSPTVQRLLAVGNISTTAPAESDGPSLPQGSKGVVVVLDFDSSRPTGGQINIPTKTEYDLDSLLPGEKLPEGAIDFEREVELVRTRTIAQRRAQDRGNEARRHSRTGPGRAHTTANRERPISVRPSIPAITRDDEEELNPEEVQAAFEAPYDHTQPRSQLSLARAATVAAVSPANRRHLRALPFRPLEYRRADGLREMPHESDADNWVPPPPAYTASADAAGSISLSHPEAPPVPRRPSPPANAVPPVPPLPAIARPSQRLVGNPYPSRGSSYQSQSSSDLTATSQMRRPSLLHPSTYPRPESAFNRRRSSATQHHAADQPLPPVPQNDTAYQATSMTYPNRRRTLRSRVESTVELRPPPIIDPATNRRGSAPGPLPTVTQDRVPNGNGSGPTAGRSAFRRAMLPRLATVGGENTHAHHQHLGPLSAPPRTRMRSRSRQEPRSRSKEKQKSPKKKIGCVVM
ncbi:hypothetical protein BCR34DRAFT_490157 [Clohesyomyces aquaticus]|uniref:DUF7165 domain-containing protein n=1 Tax=Clohesyomyces aquaticus TaxID=1231657 RepID=A0A1Y1Z8G1_9PLEO|nr:hypothetical protein BCR34DRAFT_490157 [Clohesyomyces aquaticus]